MKTALWIVASLVFLVIAAVVLAVVFVTGEHIRPYAESAASDAIGQPVSIGSLRLDKDWTLGVEASDIRVANPDWGKAEHMATLESLAFSLRLRSLLEDSLDFPTVSVSGADINVEVGPEGERNWAKADGAGEAVAPEERSEFPRLEEIAIEAINFTYRDIPRGIQHTGTLDKGTGSASESGGVVFEGEGTFNDQPASISFEGGSFTALTDAAAPYPIDLAIDAETDVSLKGTVADPASLDGADLTLKIAGPDLGVLGDLLALPLPATPPYDLSGQIATQGAKYSLNDFSGTIGDSDMRGSVSVDLGGEIPSLTGELVSKRLDFDDLAGLIGASPDLNETANAKQKADTGEDGLIPDVPIPVDELRRANIDLSFKAASVSSPIANVESIDAHINLDTGRLLVKPLTLGLAGGSAKGEIAVNVRQDVPSADIELALNGIAIRPFFARTEFVQEMGGVLSGQIYLLGSGESLDTMVRSARGSGHLVMREGQMSALIVEAAGLDVAEALGVLIGGDVKVPIRCAVTAVKADNGAISLRRLAVDTEDSLIVGQGDIDLKSERMQIQIEARAKDFSLLDFSAPVVISGTFVDPSIGIGGIDPLPFFEMGDQKDVDCQVLINAAKKEAPGRQ